MGWKSGYGFGNATRFRVELGVRAPHTSPRSIHKYNAEAFGVKNGGILRPRGCVCAGGWREWRVHAFLARPSLAASLPCSLRRGAASPRTHTQHSTRPCPWPAQPPTACRRRRGRPPAQPSPPPFAAAARLARGCRRRRRQRPAPPGPARSPPRPSSPHRAALPRPYARTPPSRAWPPSWTASSLGKRMAWSSRLRR